MTARIAPGLWPRPYILQIYSQAIAEGVVAIGPLGGEENFKSLLATFRRILRRGDKLYEVLVEPAYHLVSMTYDAERDRALAIYNRLPDGMELPAITSVDSGEMQSNIATRSPPLLLTAASELEPPVEKFDSDNFVKGLLDKVKGLNVDGAGKDEFGDTADT